MDNITGTLNMVPINAFTYRELVHKKYGAPIGDVVLMDNRLGILHGNGAYQVLLADHSTMVQIQKHLDN